MGGAASGERFVGAGVKIKQAYGAVKEKKKALGRQKVWKQDSDYRELNGDALGLKRGRQI